MSTPAPIDPTTLPWRPTVDDVAALIRARTKDASGNEIGTFTDQTRPTDAEVEQLITNGMAKIASYVGWTLPPDAEAEANHLAAIVTACEVELSYWPEQVRNDRSAYSALWAMFTANVSTFAEFVAAIAPAGGVAQQWGNVYSPSSTVDFAYRYGYGVWPISDLVNVGH
ncbi:MAG TPA: hypothetical protein VHS03_11400 [Gaiellaceae bacterium]|nr:hypothetical protein [Gaiellaceae bacterium]